MVYQSLLFEQHLVNRILRNNNEMVRKVIWSVLNWNLHYLQMSKQFQNWLVLALELGDWHRAYPREEASD